MTRIWYQKKNHLLIFILLPLSWLFALIVVFRRWLYRQHVFKVKCFPVPVIIVGNITVGGTGKTPFVISLAKFLQTQGYQPGIVGRGYGGKKQKTSLIVDASTSPQEAGDEAVLIARRTQCPVVVCVDRCQAVETLLSTTKCNIVISDDGLQHYALARDIDIVLVDPGRQFGNHYLLPAGPLREPLSRLKSVDFIVDQYQTEIIAQGFYSLKQTKQYSITEFPYKKIHAVAGIGYPEKFFDTLRQAGYELITHSFPDHFQYDKNHLNFTDAYPIVMTEKDAVKCQDFADERYWYLSIDAKISTELLNALLTKLKTLEKKTLC